MSGQLPTYYTSLKPFEALFHSGTPQLTYHKLGPRPRGVRLKGLYVVDRLFERQLAELKRNGFTTSPYGCPVKTPDNSPEKVLLTFDDGYTNVLRYGLEPLARHGFQAIQYIVAGKLGGTNDWDAPSGEIQEKLMDASQIREWLAAGHEIGSHTLNHPHLPQLSPAEAREEISASRKKLEDLFGVPIRHFCYPYGDWTPVIRDLVQSAGYETACTTEFGVNTPFTPPFELKRIMARHRSMNWRTVRELLAGRGTLY